MKKIVVLSLTLVFVLGLGVYFFFRYQKYQKDIVALFPRFSTMDLPVGSAGTLYQADIFGSLIGASAKLEITPLTMPPGLDLTSCKQSNNLSSLPRPSSMLHCQLQGTLPKGIYPIELEISARGHYNTVVQTFSVVIY